MRGGTGLLALLLLATGATTSVADNASPLTLTGPGSGYVDITLRRHVDPSALFSGWSWEGCGRYRGVIVRHLERPFAEAIGAIDLADFDYRPDVRSPLSLLRYRSGPPIPAGPVRIYLLAERACRLTIPALSWHRPLAVQRRVAVQHQAQTFNPLGLSDGLPPRWGTAEWPVTIGATTSLLVATHQVTRHRPDQVNGARCPYAYRTAEVETARRSLTSAYCGVLPTPADFDSNTVLSFGPGALPPGDYTVGGVSGGPTIEQAAVGFVAIDWEQL